MNLPESASAAAGSTAGSDAAQAFLQARDFLLQHREDLHTACSGFRWP